jgi:hypothetical protein
LVVVFILLFFLTVIISFYFSLKSEKNFAILIDSIKSRKADIPMIVNSKIDDFNKLEIIDSLELNFKEKMKPNELSHLKASKLLSRYSVKFRYIGFGSILLAIVLSYL